MNVELSLNLILELETEELYSMAEELITGYFGRVRSDHENYVFAVGENPICLVAHIDTVRPEDQLIELIKYNEFLYNKHGILGADDRAGIFLIFRILHVCTLYGIPLPSILITNYEEIGLIGVSEFVKHEQFTFSGANKSVKLFINLDKSGAYEYVTYGAEIPSNISEFVESFGFSLVESHKFSDITILSKVYGVPSVNLSIGYQAEHTLSERLNLKVYEETFQRIVGMLIEANKKLLTD